MKKLDFSLYGVEEVNQTELSEINGGLAPIAWFFLGLLAGELNDRNNINDFIEGYNSI